MNVNIKCKDCECFLKSPNVVNQGTCHLSPPQFVVVIGVSAVGVPAGSEVACKYPVVHSDGVGCMGFRAIVLSDKDSLVKKFESD